jgi:hypothetical protein
VTCLCKSLWANMSHVYSNFSAGTTRNLVSFFDLINVTEEGMWSLPKTCLNYVNYIVLGNWRLTKGNLSFTQLNPQQERDP